MNDIHRSNQRIEWSKTSIQKRFSPENARTVCRFLTRVKWIMIQAAYVAVIHDERMKMVYENARKRNPPQVAITHVAHKMGTTIYHMLKNNTTYNEKNPQLYQRKLEWSWQGRMPWLDSIAEVTVQTRKN